MINKSTISGLFAAIDRKDGAEFASYVAEDCIFKFGNGDPVTGRANIRQAVDGFFASVRSLAHTVADVVELGDHLVSRGTVTYVRHNGSTLSIPFCNFFKLKNGLVQDYQIYGDISKLYAE